MSLIQAGSDVRRFGRGWRLSGFGICLSGVLEDGGRGGLLASYGVDCSRRLKIEVRADPAVIVEGACSGSLVVRRLLKS